MTANPKPKSARIRLAVVGGLLLAGALTAFFLVRGGSAPYVQLTNGFEVEVELTFTDASGGTEVIKIPARGRVGADLAGTYKVAVAAAGKPIAEAKSVTFKASGDRKKGCFQYYNVLGSAAILAEDVVYGVGFKGGGTLLSGQVLTTVCPTWGFETEKPPEAIQTKKGDMGRNLTWLHYVGAGDWHASISALLAQKPDVADQSRIRAWNLAVSMSKIDPENARLVAFGPAFKHACDTIMIDFESGPMAGKNKRDCMKATKGLFPKAF